MNLQINKYILISFSLLYLLTGCHNNVKNDVTFFGGHIKNPKDDKVLIFKKDSNIAIAKLDHNNKFIFKLDSLKEGLYKFKHGEEIQYIYLENKDSLLLRLNTWDFDGSLVFSGKGASKNNLLIQLFLENEQEDRNFYDYFKLDEEAFLAKADSFIQLKTTLYKQYKENVKNQSNVFENLISDVIYLPIYINKETYPLQYKKYHQQEKLPKLSATFYNHRDIVKEKDQLFKDYYTYQKYLWSKVYNSALYQIEKDTLIDLSIALLNNINHFVCDDELKNKMLQHSYINSLFDDLCTDKNKEKTKNIFYKSCSDHYRKDEVSKMLKVIETIKKNEYLPEFYLKNIDGETFNSHNIIANKTVIYFWPKEVNRIENMAKRIHYLIKKYPAIRFIGIDGQLANYNWKSYVKANHLDFKNQFQLVSPTSQTFFTNDFPRAIIINNKGIVIHNFTFISNRNFEKLLQD